MEKCVVVDDFFDDPYKMIDYQKTLDYHKRDEDQNWEGLRTPNLLETDPDFYLDITTRLIYNYYDRTKTYSVTGHLNFHRLTNEDKKDIKWIEKKIHQDAYDLISIIYLTPNAPMTSGTQIYRETENGKIPDVIFHNKFNRLIQFPAYEWHSAMDLDGGDEERLTLLFFLEKIEEVKVD